MSADVASAASMGIGTALPPAPDPALLDDLVAANRILCDHGILDAYGHISARDPQHREHYWISRSMPPALVTAADIIACDLDNNPVRQGETRLFFERVIAAPGDPARRLDDEALDTKAHNLLDRLIGRPRVDELIGLARRSLTDEAACRVLAEAFVGCFPTRA